MTLPTVMVRPIPKYPMHVQFNLIMYCTPNNKVFVKLYLLKWIKNWELFNCFVT